MGQNIFLWLGEKIWSFGDKSFRKGKKKNILEMTSGVSIQDMNTKTASFVEHLKHSYLGLVLCFKESCMHLQLDE